MEFTSYTETTETFETSGPNPATETKNSGNPAREAELESDLRRLQAEYVNYRKRVERDRDVARETTIQSTLTSLLPVLDGITEARKHGELEDGPFAAIAVKLESTLAQLGLDCVDEVGVVFDPTIHEAVVYQPHDEVPVEHVSAVFRNGYRIGERTIRAAQVMVSAG